jgi:hypothetical protein
VAKSTRALPYFSADEARELSEASRKQFKKTWVTEAEKQLPAILDAIRAAAGLGEFELNYSLIQQQLCRPVGDLLLGLGFGCTFVRWGDILITW